MSQLAEQDEEIDLRELFTTIWYNWRTVALATILSVAFAALYAFELATPEYAASTRFELVEADAGAAALGQAADLAGLAGVGVPGAISEADTIADRVLSRPFIDSIYEEAGFGTDPEFNEELQESGLVETLIAFVFGLQDDKEVSRNDYLNMAIDTLRKKMALNIGENGINELTVSHPDAKRAADVANIIVSQSLQDIFERERNETRQSLGYFADELLQIRLDLDAANAAVRDYAITNSLQSAGELARTSSQLAEVRRDLDAIDESILALEKMGIGDFDGLEFSQAYPISTSSSFRRLLNFSGDPSNWEKPSSADLKRAVDRLEAQKSPLISSFNALQARAMSSGAEALELAALEREVEIQQAIYSSVITQFEARSLHSGYERASGRIVEAAIMPQKPASPKKPMVLAIGVVLGLFIGAAWALMASKKRGTLYSDTAIKTAFASSDVRKRKRSQLGGVDTAELTQKQLTAVQDLLVSFAEEEQVISIISTRPNDLVSRLSLSLSKASARLSEKTAILDLSNGSLEALTRATDGTSENFTSKYTIYPDIDLLVPSKTDVFLKASERSRYLLKLKEIYGRVLIVLPAPQNGTAVSRVVAPSTDASIFVAERGKTNLGSVEAIKSIFTRSKMSDPLLVIV
ncbi:GNVR domain-containing protein [Cognatishimia sp. D5M38]|uniref:GNVR domain-containing protein n=1 Tax=Cognatishimia coralii TaxID=3083254 RepID=A0ABU8QKX7_9RHOB